MSSLQEIREIHAARFNRHQEALAKQRQEKVDDIIERLKIAMASDTFIAIQAFFRWLRKVVRIQLMWRAYLLRHQQRLKAANEARKLDPDSDSSINDKRRREFDCSLANDLNRRKVWNTPLLAAFLDRNVYSNTIPSTNEIWYQLIFSQTEMKDELRYPEEMCLRRVWVLSHPTKEMVRLLGRDICEMECKEEIQRAKRLCEKRVPSPSIAVDNLEEQNQFEQPEIDGGSDVKLCAQCNDPAVDLIGDLPFCFRCISELLQ